VIAVLDREGLLRDVALRWLRVWERIRAVADPFSEIASERARARWLAGHLAPGFAGVFDRLVRDIIVDGSVPHLDVADVALLRAVADAEARLSEFEVGA